MEIALGTQNPPHSPLVLPCCACDSRAEDARLPRTAASNVMVTSDDGLGIINAQRAGAVAAILVCTGYLLFLPSIEEEKSSMT